MAVDEERDQQPPWRLEVSGPVRGVAHVAPEGELDLVSAPELERSVGTLLDAGAEQIVVHLAGLTFLDSSGLRALLVVEAAATARGAVLCLLPGGPEVMRVVEIAGLLGRLPFAERDQP
jgi:anti-anti-sigma factor